MRDYVRRIQADLRQGGLPPDTAREHQLTLSALLGNCVDEEREAEMAYKAVLLDAYRTEQKANRAKLVAENTEAYHRYREAHDAVKLVTEMIRSCRAYLRSLDEEMRLAK